MKPRLGVTASLLLLSLLIVSPPPRGQATPAGELTVGSIGGSVPGVV